MPTRDISLALETAITEQKPTLQLLLKITLRDDTVLGFAKYPVPIVYDGVTYRPGLNISVVQSQVGLTVDNLEAGGGYKDGIITEAEVAAGIYDKAQARVLLIDREDHSAGHVIVQRGYVREIRSKDDLFSVEISSLVSLAQANVGELTSPYCRVPVFSTRCGLNVNGTHPTLSKAYKWTGGTVSVVNSRIIFRANDSNSYPTGFFTDGTVTWTSGGNSGVVSQVKAHGLNTGVAIFTLHEPPRKAAIVVGDQFTVTFGCNHTLAKCASVQNVVNFQGFAHLPGSRRALAAK